MRETCPGRQKLRACFLIIMAWNSKIADMKKFFVFMFLLPLAALGLSAQNKADDIVGKWFAEQDGVESFVEIMRSADGTYMAQVRWVEDSVGPDGKKVLDVKNPDRSLRNVPVDEIVLFRGLEFNEKKNCWDGTKIYDPTRGIKANVSCSLVEGGKILRLRGSVLGIGETVEWVRQD